MTPGRKLVLFGVITQLLLCEVHLVPDEDLNQTKGDVPSGLPTNDTEGNRQNMSPAKMSTSMLATPSQPISINVTSTETNMTGRNDAEPPGDHLENHTESDLFNDTKDAKVNDHLDATLTNENATTDGSVTYNEIVTSVSHVTSQDESVGNVTSNGTGILPSELSTDTPTVLPILTGSTRPDWVLGGDTKPPPGSPGPTTLPPVFRPTPSPASPSATPGDGLSSTTLLLPSGVKTTTLTVPTSSVMPVTARLLTTLPPTTTTTTVRITTTSPVQTTRRSSTQTHHKVPAVPRPDRGEADMSSGRGEIAGMDPLALGIGICIPVLLIIVVILSVFCYRKYKKGGRGYITLDDFGTFEGMNNPNYDGEL